MPNQLQHDAGSFILQFLEPILLCLTPHAEWFHVLYKNHNTEPEPEDATIHQLSDFYRHDDLWDSD